MRAGFEEVFVAAARSAPLRRVFRKGFPDLPDWAQTFSFVPASGLLRLADALHLGPGRRMLDLACGAGGPGLLIAEHSGSEVVGIDFVEAGPRTARQTASQRDVEAAYGVASGHQLPLRTASVDAAICIDAIRFIPGFGLEELRRVVRPGGFVGITAWRRPAQDVFPSFGDPESAFEAAGFEPLLMEFHPEWVDGQRTTYEAAIALEEAGETDPAVAMMAEEGREVLPVLKSDDRFALVARRPR